MKHHPVWRIVEIAVLFGGATFFAWINASEFDHTEWKMIGEMAVAYLAWNGVKAKVSHAEPNQRTPE